MSPKQLYQRWLASVPLVLFSFILLGETSPNGNIGPVPPCESLTIPPFPNINEAPTVRVWSRSDLSPNWMPPACTGWTAPGFTTLVVTVARFHHSSGIESLLQRIGAISELAGVRYWSISHKQWQTLITNAFALSGPTGGQRRKDFSLDEVTEDKFLYYQQNDNLSGKAICRLHIQSVSSDRLVFGTENISTLKYFLLPIFRPGEMQSIYFLERESPNIWRYYSIARTGAGASRLTAGHAASSINRAIAFYRYLAAIPTDQEPPAAP